LNEIAPPRQLCRYTPMVNAGTKHLAIAIALVMSSPAIMCNAHPSAQTKVGVPAAGWQRAEACGIAFQLPAEIQRHTRGELDADLCNETFENDSVSIVIEADGFGAFASNRSITNFADFAQKRNFRRAYTKVSSRKAVIVSYEEPNDVRGFRYRMAISIFAKRALRVFVLLKNRSDRTIAETILRSIVIVDKSRV
jgi:hypothetical protein